MKREYLEEGSCYGYGKDKDGKKLLVIKLKLHVKGVKEFAELQRCIVYWFERLERYTRILILYRIANMILPKEKKFMNKMFMISTFFW